MRILQATLVFLIVIGLSSCAKSDSDEIPEPVSNTEAIVKNTLSKGSWRVSYFLFNGSTKTSNFDDYNFTFMSSGSVSAANSSETVDGTWSTSSENGQLKLTIEFSEPADFINLSDKWNIVERTDSKIRLDVLRASGSTSKNALTFVSN